ncbi:MAG TPA: amidohydrolase family protein [Rhodanobacteraceae bacterium]
MEAVVAAAHDYGFTVAVHAHGAEGIRRAIAGGVDSIKHGTYTDDADFKLMKQHGTWLVPTIIAGEWVKQKADEGSYPAQAAPGRAKVEPARTTAERRRLQERVRLDGNRLRAVQ